jgi:ribosomal-protein-alanine N-acetyltransferase
MLVVRKATIEDLPAMIQLERGCSTAAHWVEQQYRELLEGDSGSAVRFAWVAEGQGASAVAGFLVARLVASEWELENIVVARGSRGKGIGTQLMQALLGHATQTKSESVFLEVRESNTTARRLYEKLGFQQIGRRKSYYANPLEDSVLYSKDLRKVRS